VTLGNVDGEIAGLTISDPPPQAEVQALRDKCEELADDARALAAVVHALPGSLLPARMVMHRRELLRTNACPSRLRHHTCPLRLVLLPGSKIPCSRRTDSWLSSPATLRHSQL
jgi:hypothetical protein